MAEEKKFRESMRIQSVKGSALGINGLTIRQAARAYEQYILVQEQPFILCLNYINQYVNSLREQGAISSFLEFRARIKATSSALQNDGRKALDDIFGLEFIGATDEELAIIKEKLEEIFEVVREKQMDKENGYKAVHCCYCLKDSFSRILNNISQQKGGCQYKKEYFPAIEVQYKTIGVFYEANFGTASHEKYKKAKISQIQEMYNNNQLKHGIHVPYMWISNANQPDVDELSLEETIKKMYPSLKLKEKRSVELDETQNSR